MRNLRILRLHLGRSSAEVACEARINIDTFQKIERGRVNPSAAELARIAKALHVSDPQWLLRTFEMDAPTTVGGVRDEQAAEAAVSR